MNLLEPINDQDKIPTFEPPSSQIILFIKLFNFYQTLHVLLEDTLFTRISQIVSLDPKSN